MSGAWGGGGRPRAFDRVDERDLQPLSPLLDPHDLLDRLLAPRSGLHRVVVGHDRHGAAAHRPHPGDHAVGGRVRLLVAREEEVFLGFGPRVEEQLQAIANEELAFLLELVAVLDVPLLDAAALPPLPPLAHWPLGWWAVA